MSRLLRFYLDRAPIDSLPNGLCEEMKEHYLIDDDDQTISFSGIVMTSTGVSVFLPRNSPIPPQNSLIGYRYASLLMKGLKRYTHDKALHKINSEGDGVLGGSRFSVIFDLLEDYTTYGLYAQRFRESVMNTGKPDWRRTVASQVAFVGDSGPIYLDVYGSRLRSVSNCEVARIHAFVVRELDQAYSWVITGSDVSIADAVADIPLPIESKESMIRVLEKELSVIYSEREIRLIGLLIDYIRNTHGKKTSKEIIGLRYFHGMWEKMLNSTLKWVFPVNSLLAIPAYRFADGSLRPAASKAQQTDTVMKSLDGNRFVVVDAKYYGAKGFKSAPGWGDIVKQFFYAKALGSYSKGADVDNAFVFPGSGPLRSIHMQERKSLQVLDLDYPSIRCTYIEPMELLECYVSGRKLEKLSAELMDI